MGMKINYFRDAKFPDEYAKDFSCFWKCSSFVSTLLLCFINWLFRINFSINEEKGNINEEYGL